MRAEEVLVAVNFYQMLLCEPSHIAQQILHHVLIYYTTLGGSINTQGFLVLSMSLVRCGGAQLRKI